MYFQYVGLAKMLSSVPADYNIVKKDTNTVWREEGCLPLVGLVLGPSGGVV